MSEPSVGRRPVLTPARIIAALTLLAVILRVWRVGHWGFEGDEVFTLRDSLNPKLTNPRPLLYFLNYFLVRPFLPLDEFGLRLLPVIFGILAIPVLYLVARRLVGTRAALFAALLLAVNPMQVYYSQSARYWSLVFLLSAIYPYALYLGVSERQRGWLAVGLIAGILAVLAYPTALLLAGGLGFFAASQLRRDQLQRLWDRRSFRWGTLLAAILAVVVVARYLLVLRGWVYDRPRLDVPDHFLHSPGGPFIKQAVVLLTYIDGLTLPVVMIGLLGIYLLWRSRDRSFARLLIWLFLFPAAFILLLGFRTAVSAKHILPTAPVFFIGAGVFLDRLAALDWELRPRWLLSGLVTALVILAGAPTLISQYLDGRRNDFRGAARWLNQEVAPGDVVFSDQYLVLSHYLPGLEAQPLVADPALLMRSVRDSGAGGAVWIVKPVALEGGHRTTPGLGKFKTWIYQNCQLRTSIGVARLDFRHNELQVYRCPVMASAHTISPEIAPTVREGKSGASPPPFGRNSN